MKKIYRNKKRHTYCIAQYQIPYIQMLFENKKDGEYYVLESGNGYADIIQYTAKYNDLHIATVKVSSLNFANRLG